MVVRRSIFRDQLHIFGLVGIAVAYPVFTFLLANPAYLVANRVSSQHLYFIVALPILILPALLGVIILALGWAWGAQRIAQHEHLTGAVGVSLSEGPAVAGVSQVD